MLKNRKIATMKNYSEHHGYSLKLDFDHAKGEFISKPIAHDFAGKPMQNIVVKKLVELRQLDRRKRAKQQAAAILSDTTAQLRDDLGVTEFFDTTSNSR